MEDIISPIERRRRTALRFWHAAENARFSSRVLWSTCSEAANAIRSEFFCGDANSEALVEGYPSHLAPACAGEFRKHFSAHHTRQKNLEAGRQIQATGLKCVHF